MANKYYDTILSQLKPFLTEQGFAQSPDAPEIYLNGQKAVKIAYNDKRKMFLLYMADVIEGEGVDFKELSGWLFDDSHGEKDAIVIAEDFQKAISGELGLAPTKGKIQREVSLPSKNAEGQTPGVEALAKRFLDLFPQYKPVYKDDVAKYGEFMYDDFFAKTAAVKLKELTTQEGFSKKHLVKFFTMMNDLFAEGDNNVASTIMFTILGGAFGGDLALFDSMKDYYADCPYIKQNGRVMISMIASKKQYQEALKR